MADDSPEKLGSPIKVELSAKASATLDIKAEIPAEASGRLVDALTDIIRPFTERRGLKADLLRLQREEVLIEIAQKARQRAAEENISLNPVPNKFMIPFLERGSAEEPDSPLVDRWATLLVSASRDYSSRFILYTNILANLGPEDVHFLDGMVTDFRGTQSDSNYKRQLGDTPGLFSFEEIQRNFLSSFDDNIRTHERVMRKMIDKYEWPGVYFRYVAFYDPNEHFIDISRNGKGYPHREQFSISALESQGVIQENECVHHLDTTTCVQVCAMTYLGVDFYRSCTGTHKVSNT